MTIRRLISHPYSVAGLPLALILSGLLGLTFLHHLPEQLGALVGLERIAVVYPAGWPLWLPWAAMLAAFLLLQRDSTAPGWRPHPLADQRASILAVAALAGIVAVGVFLRIQPLLDTPQRAAAVYLDYDEAVYTGAGTLMRQGFWPYRDFFLPHPPFGMALISGALRFQGVEQLDLATFVQLRQALAWVEGLTIIGLYLTVRRVGGVRAGLISALAYALGGLLIVLGRQVMLEPLQAPWLMFAAAAYVRCLDSQHSQRWAAVAGGMIAAACTIKLVGAVLGITLFVHLLALRRWPELRWFVGGGLGVALLILTPFLLHAPQELPRQVILAQLGRTQYGLTPFRRAQVLWSQPTQALLAVGSVLGLIRLMIAARARQLHPGWSALLLWGTGLWAFIGSSPSFYEHYYASLALGPACLIGACGLPLFAQQRRSIVPRMGSVATVLLPLLLARETQTYASILRDDYLIEAAELLRTSVDPDATILAFEPTAALLAGHNPARLANGQFLLDTFLGWSTLGQAPGGYSEQDHTKALLDQADVVLLDQGRLSSAQPATWELIQSRLAREFWYRPFVKHPTLPEALYYRVAPADSVASFGPSLELLSSEPAQASSTAITVTTYWRAQALPDPDQMFFIHVVDATDRKIGQIDLPLRADHQWQLGRVLPLQIIIPLNATPPDGSYRLIAGVYSLTTGLRAPASFRGDPLPGEAVWLGDLHCQAGVCGDRP